MLKFKYQILFLVIGVVLLTSLWANNIYLLVIFSIFTYAILPVRKYWDGTTCAIFAFSFLYSTVVLITKQYTSGFILISLLISPVGFYRFGRWLMSCFREEKIRHYIILYLILCYILPLLIITFKDIAIVGIVNTSRVMLGEVDDAGGLSATGYGLIASFGIGGIASLFTKSKPVFIKVTYAVLSILSLLVVVHLVNRTGLITFLCCFILTAIISAKTSKSRNLVILVTVGTIIMLILKSVGGPITEVIEAYQYREIHSIDATQLGGRSAIWMDALTKLATHPLGWSRIHYAHNMWLDIARVGGWGALFLFIIVTYNWFKCVIKVTQKSFTPFALIIVSINIAMFLSSFVEPIIDASVLYFALLMLILGVTTSISLE